MFLVRTNNGKHAITHTASLVLSSLVINFDSYHGEVVLKAYTAILTLNVNGGCIEVSSALASLPSTNVFCKQRFFSEFEIDHQINICDSLRFPDESHNIISMGTAMQYQQTSLKIRLMLVGL
jgi:hypothetical protein